MQQTRRGSGRKDAVLSIRVRESEYKAIAARARERDLTVSGYIVAAALEAPVRQLIQIINASSVDEAGHIAEHLTDGTQIDEDTQRTILIRYRDALREANLRPATQP